LGALSWFYFLDWGEDLFEKFDLSVGVLWVSEEFTLKKIFL
jgi:hypothetical protein